MATPLAYRAAIGLALAAMGAGSGSSTDEKWPWTRRKAVLEYSFYDFDRSMIGLGVCWYCFKTTITGSDLLSHRKVMSAQCCGYQHINRIPRLHISD